MTKKLDRIKQFVNDHSAEIVVVGVTASAYIVGFLALKKGAELIEKHYDVVLHYNELQAGVIAKHDFKYDPETQTLWDITINPHRA